MEIQDLTSGGTFLLTQSMVGWDQITRVSCSKEKHELLPQISLPSVLYNCEAPHVLKRARPTSVAQVLPFSCLLCPLLWGFRYFHLTSIVYWT